MFSRKICNKATTSDLTTSPHLSTFAEPSLILSISGSWPTKQDL